jgi:hypothetical protein
MRPSRAAVSMSWFDDLVYAPPDRAKGIRLPPTTTARRGVETAAEATGLLGSMGPVTDWPSTDIGVSSVVDCY